MYIGPWQAITNTPLKRWFVQSQPRVVPTVRRTGWPGKTAYQTVLDGLKNGKSLLIFPEGDSYPDEGSLMPFLNGVGHFALRTGVPIVPAGLCGTAELYYRKCLWMHLGRPIFVPLVPRPSGSQVAEVVEEVRECVRRLVEGYRDPIVAHKPMHWLTHLL
jgi:1-acyl-sn-glycerol-3-phosphate acyltransferase